MPSKARLWKVVDYSARGFEVPLVRCLSYSPDGKGVSSNGVIMMSEINADRETKMTCLLSPSVGESIRTVEFSPDHCDCS